MQRLFDLLTFKHFIAAEVLMGCYYIGALFIPLLLYFGRRSLIRHSTIVQKFATRCREGFTSLRLRNRLLLMLSFILLFSAMEIVWRMMFEMMIGYFQMHDYLQQIAERV